MFEALDYVELYVADGEKAASLLCAAHGFRKVAEAGPRRGSRPSARCCWRRARRGCC
jgi:hypothetical protein